MDPVTTTLGKIGVEGRMGALHRAFRAVAAKLLLGEAGHDDRQFMRGQGVGVVEDRRHRQVLAAHGSVDDDLEALDGREHIDGAPVAAGPVVIED